MPTGCWDIKKVALCRSLLAHLCPAHNWLQLKKLWPGRQQRQALCAGIRRCPGQCAVSVCLLRKGCTGRAWCLASPPKAFCRGLITTASGG